MATQLNCCCICMGGARLRQAFGLSLNKAKCFWIECDCGLRTPMCDSQEDAINFWNWLNRETKANAIFGEDRTGSLSLWGLNSTQVIGILGLIWIIVVTLISSQGINAIKKITSVGGCAITLLNIL